MALVCLTLILSGCATKLLRQPTVVARSETTISIKAGLWADARSVAVAHCKRFGRVAVLVSQGPISHDKILRLFVFDCREREDR